MKTEFNIFKFRILVLMVCRGTAELKCQFLFELIYGPNISNIDILYQNNSRLQNAVEAFLFFSHLLPKLFYIDWLQSDTEFIDNFDKLRRRSLSKVAKNQNRLSNASGKGAVTKMSNFQE